MVALCFRDVTGQVKYRRASSRFGPKLLSTKQRQFRRDSSWWRKWEVRRRQMDTPPQNLKHWLEETLLPPFVKHLHLYSTYYWAAWDWKMDMDSGSKPCVTLRHFGYNTSVRHGSVVLNSQAGISWTKGGGKGPNTPNWNGQEWL